MPEGSKKVHSYACTAFCQCTLTIADAAIVLCWLPEEILWPDDVHGWVTVGFGKATEAEGVALVGCGCATFLTL